MPGVRTKDFVERRKLLKRGILATLAVVMLTAKLGRITYMDHEETWYNLPMKRVCSKAAANGIVLDYWERADGCKMYGKFIICAGAPERYGEIVETSRGTGIIIDTGEFAKRNPTMIDIATTW